MLWQLAYTEYFFLKKNYGLILIIKISKKLLQILKRVKEIMDLYNEQKLKKRILTSVVLLILLFF